MELTLGKLKKNFGATLPTKKFICFVCKINEEQSIR